MEMKEEERSKSRREGECDEEMEGIRRKDGGKKDER